MTATSSRLAGGSAEAARPVSLRLSPSATVVVALIAVGLAAAAFAQNRAVLQGLSSPGFDIQYREAAAAQTILDEGYGPDSAYTHERVWYNPMTSWILAAASRASGSAVSTVSVVLGPYVNLAAPAALFLLASLLFDGVVALIAVAAFIFTVGTQFPFYYSATYSPWMAPENIAQAWLYLALAAAYRAFLPRAALWWSVACGAMLGLTFLTHTAPALLAGAVIVQLGVMNARTLGRQAALTRIVVALGAAFLVSLPFSVEILWHYGLRIVNQFPSQSPSSLLDLNELPSLLRTVAASAAFAGIALAARAARRLDQGMRIVLAWLGTIVVLLAANIARMLLDKLGIHLPPVVPAFHFFAYLMTIVAIGIGVGVRDACQLFAEQLALRRGRRPESAAAGQLLACGMAVLMVAASYPRYRLRQDFSALKEEAITMNHEFPLDAVSWIRDHSSPSDVFLCTDDGSLYVVGPAGRKVVATNRYFSNPYVDWQTRDDDRRAMFELLHRGDIDGFRTAAGKYNVRFVMITRDRSDLWLKAAGLRPGDLPEIDFSALSHGPALEVAFENPRFVIMVIHQSQRAGGR